MTTDNDNGGGCLVIIVFLIAFSALSYGISNLQDSIDHLQETIEQQGTK